MSKLLASSAILLGLALPTISSAQEIEVSSGVTLTSRYIANGIAQTDGPAIQPWIEVGASGFYLGLWASNTSVAITGSKYEADIYAGYRNEVGKFSYDIGYAHYYGIEPNTDWGGEVILSMAVAPVDPLSIGVRFALNPKTDVLNSSLSIDYAVNDKLGLSATYGSINKGGHDYYSVGASYAITDMVSVSASWVDTTITKGMAVASIDFSF